METNKLSGLHNYPRMRLGNIHMQSRLQRLTPLSPTCLLVLLDVHDEADFAAQPAVNVRAKASLQHRRAPPALQGLIEEFLLSTG